MNKTILFTWPFLFITTVLYSGSLFISKTPVHPKKEVKTVSSPSTRLKSTVSEYVLQTFGKQSSIAFQIMQDHNLDCNYGANTTHQGLFAIDKNDPRVSGDLLNCINNIDMAKKIYDQEGWKPWNK